MPFALLRSVLNKRADSVCVNWVKTSPVKVARPAPSRSSAFSIHQAMMVRLVASRLNAVGRISLLKVSSRMVPPQVFRWTWSCPTTSWSDGRVPASFDLIGKEDAHHQDADNWRLQLSVPQLTAWPGYWPTPSRFWKTSLGDGIRDVFVGICNSSVWHRSVLHTVGLRRCFSAALHL